LIAPPESHDLPISKGDAKSDAHRLQSGAKASQHPTASARTASFRLLVTPQTQRGCAARCEQAQPRAILHSGRRGFDARAAGAAIPARRSRARTGEAGTLYAHSATTRARRRRPRVVAEWAERDSNPLRFTAGFKGSGAKRRRKRHTRARRGRRGGRAGAARGARRLGRGSGGLVAAEGTRGNVAAEGAGDAGPAGGPGARPRVLPGAGHMLLARRRSWRGRLSLFREGVTGTETDNSSAPVPARAYPADRKASGVDQRQRAVRRRHRVARRRPPLCEKFA
jgi:hypothetical protein